MPKERSARELYEELIEGARRAYLASEADYFKGQGPLGRAYHSSRLLMEGERDAASTPEDRRRALENHVERMRKLARHNSEYGNLDDANSAEAGAYLAESELLLAQVKAPKTAPAAVQPAPAVRADGPGNDARSLAVLARLDEPIAMSFPNETPLEDVLSYIKQATTSANRAAIPIYVDPLGLQEADKSLTSTVQIDLEGIPLRRTLQLALRPLGLGYFVEDGILIITSQESGDQGRIGQAQIGPSPLLEKQNRLERGEMTIEEMQSFARELKVTTEIRKQLLDIEELDEMRRNPARRHGINADQAASLFKEVKELIDELKTQRPRAKPEGSK